MNKIRFNARNVILAVLFVMILICSAISISYSYYSPATDSTMFDFTTTIPCLNLTGTSIFNFSTPSVFAPTTDSDALAQTTLAVNTRQRIGTIQFSITDACSTGTQDYVNIAFIPDSQNDIDMSYIRFAICSEQYNSCNSANLFSTPRNLYNAGDCFLSTSTPTGFWNYMATTYSLKSGAYMCNILSYMPIEGGQSAYKTLIYWLSDSGSSQVGKKLSGKFVAYSSNYSDNQGL